MNPEEITVTPPRKEGISAEAEQIAVWPAVEAALNLIEADEVTRDAARVALTCSDGCIVLANYLNSEAKRVVKMDYRFKVPLLVLAADMARTDGRADSFYDPDEGALYFETDEHQFSFHVFKDWTVAWDVVADEVVKGYEWSGIENQTWALDILLAYLELDLGAYLPPADEEE
ncbi:MAG: hypothetical protein R2834_17485 [Rhodothermales bacterium]